MRKQYGLDLTRGFPMIVIAVAVFAALLGDVEERYIFTFAGTGEVGAGGDGGAATEAQLVTPAGLLVDGSGNLYVADAGSGQIRRIDTGGVITTIAGTGERGYSGDGGPATEAQLVGPSGLLVDGSGNLYVTDLFNNRIRRIDAEGVITTIAGTGERGYSGDGGPAAEAQLAWPSGLLVDGLGNLYVADRANNRIRRIDAEGVITTIAGTGDWGFGGDGGPATEAQLASPSGLLVDGSGNLYVTDNSNHRIRRIDAEGMITTIAGTGERGYSGDGGPAAEAQLGWPEASGGRVGEPLRSRPNQPSSPGHQTAGRKESCHQGVSALRQWRLHRLRLGIGERGYQDGHSGGPFLQF